MHCVLKPSQWTGRSRCYTLTNLNESPSKCKTRNCENVTAPSSVSLIQWSWRCSQNSLQRILWIFCVCVSKKSVHLHLSSNTLLIKVRSALYLWILMQFSKASKKNSVYTHSMGSFLIFFFTAGIIIKSYSDFHFKRLSLPYYLSLYLTNLHGDGDNRPMRNKGLVKSHIMLFGSNSANKSLFH